MTEKSTNTTFGMKVTSALASNREPNLQSIEGDVLRLHALSHRQLCRHILSLGLNTFDAEDILQESFLELFRHLLADRSRENLSGWLFRVAHRIAIKRRRQHHSSHFVAHEVNLDSYATKIFTPEEEAIFDERQRKLQNIFLALPESDRLCLQLRSEGMSYREIASTLNISLGSVHNSIAKSFGRFKAGQGESAGR